MPIRQSVSWWCFAGRGVADDVLLRQAKAIGYEAVELIGEDLFDRAQGAGLVIASHNGHQSIERGLNDPAEHDRIEAEIVSKLELAQRYQIPNLIVFSGSRRAGLSEEEGIENTARGLARVKDAAEQAGVNLVLELLNSKVDHPGYQCDHTTWGVEVCRRVGSPRVGLLYDIYHMQIMEGDVMQTIGTHHAHFLHYHTAGVPGRHDLDETQELNYPPIIKAIAATGYEGYLGHEFIPKGDPVAALEAAYRVGDV